MDARVEARGLRLEWVGVITSLLSLSRPVVIAHRGGSKLRPENSMIAFDHAVALGVDALECDVHLSRDDQPVVIHDFTLERTTDGVGIVADFTAAELGALDAGYRYGEAAGFPHRGRAGGVPTLAALLRRFPAMPVIVEIKGERVDVATRTLDVVRECGAEHRVLIGGFSHEVLQAVRSLHPAVPTSASRQEVQSALRRSYVRWPPRRTGYEVFQVPVRLRGQRILNRALVTVARRAEVPVHAWIVDDAAEMRLLRTWGVTGLISDRPDIALEVVRAERAQL